MVNAMQHARMVQDGRVVVIHGVERVGVRDVDILKEQAADGPEC